MPKVSKGMLKLYMKLCTRQMESHDKKQRKITRTNEAIRIQRNISYRGDGENGHVLDIFYPEQEPAEKLMIINIHGGRLFSGSKERNEEFNLCLAERGAQVISLNYRLVPDVGFLDQIEDILHAFQWIYEQRKELGYDPDRVCLTGDSAGALLAFYAAAINLKEEMQKIFMIKGSQLQIRALGLISGMFYLNKKDVIGRMHPLLFRGNYREAAYLPYINPRRMITSCNLPPCFLVTSEEDILKDYTLEFNAALERHRCSHQMHCFAKGTENELVHAFCVVHPEWKESRQTLDEMLEYFRRCCSGMEGNF